MSSGDKSIPLPQFIGKGDYYLMWQGKMRGFAMAKDIWVAVTNTEKLPNKQGDVLDAATDEVGIKARKANSLLMVYLMNAFKKSSDTKIVMNAVTDDWPIGKAVEVFRKLDRTYRTCRLISNWRGSCSRLASKGTMIPKRCLSRLMTLQLGMTPVQRRLKSQRNFRW